MKRFQVVVCFLLAILDIEAWALERPGRQVSLDGQWEMAHDTDINTPPSTGWAPQVVPMPMFGNTGQVVWYRRTIQIPAQWPGAHIYFNGIKYECRVLLDGQEVGHRRFGGYTPWEVDLGGTVLPGQDQELLVGCRDWSSIFHHPVDLETLAQQSEDLRHLVPDLLLDPIGGHYGAFGIWDFVTLIETSNVMVKSVRITTSVRQGTLSVKARLRNTTGSATTTSYSWEIRDAHDLVVLSGTGTSGSIDPGGETEVSVHDGVWNAARFWSPEDPYLYRLHVTVTGDHVVERFGFREFWTEGARFYLNGNPVRLLAASSWPYITPLDDETVRGTVQDLIDGNVNIFRFHTQPWRSVWYDTADELGLLVVEEAPLWCDGAGTYRYGDDLFWDNYRATLQGMLDRHGNHPSLVMWSLENELLHCGGQQYDPQLGQKLGDIGRFMKQIDGTRPITFESDMDPDSAADVLGLHYAIEFPGHLNWPQDAWWLDSEIPHPFLPGTWRWDRQKPLYIGEYMWMPSPDPRPLSIFFSDDVYRNIYLYRNRTKALLWSFQIPAFRAQDLSAQSPWTIAEDTAANGVADLNPGENLLYQVTADAYRPLMAWDQEVSCRLYSAESSKRRIWVFNDSPAALGSAELVVELGSSSQRITISTPPATSQSFEVTLDAPSEDAKTELPLRLEIREGDQTVFFSEKECSVWPRARPSLPADARVGLFDPSGSTRSLIESLGVNYIAVEAIDQQPQNLDLLILGEDSFPQPAVPQVGPLHLLDANNLIAPARDGATVLVLAQSGDGSSTLGLAPVVHPRRPLHPILSGLQPEDLRHWQTSGPMVELPLPKPYKGVSRIVVDLADQNGLQYAGVLEMPIGLGRIVFCQIPLVLASQTEPAARKLLSNLVEHGATAPAEDPAMLGILGGGLNPWFRENLVGFVDLDAGETTLACPDIVAAAGVIESNTLKELTDRGVTVLLKHPDDAALSTVEGLTGALGLKIRERPAYPLYSIDGFEETRGLCGEDLYWLGPRSHDWRHPTSLAGGICDAHFVRDFDPAAATQINGADLDHGQGAAPQGQALNFFANAAATTTMDITDPGATILAFEAQGTPCDGEWPLMVILVDGEALGTHLVASGVPEMYVNEVELSIGAHTLLVAFINDAWNPPEDRNLLLHRVLWKKDTEPPRAQRLTEPAALAKVDIGSGTLLLDLINWDTDTTHPVQSQRIGATLLSNLSVQSAPDLTLDIEAEEMEPVDLVFTSVVEGFVNLGDDGSLKYRVEFLQAGPYEFTVKALGTPFHGVYPRPAVAVDGAEIGRFDVTGEPAEYAITADVARGAHDVEIVFDDDVYEPGGDDRNLYVDFLRIGWISGATRQPIAKLQGPQQAHVGEDVTFSAVCSVGEGALTFVFDFGDGAPLHTTDQPEATHVYTTTGEYLVRLWASDSFDQVAVDGLVLTVIGGDQDGGTDGGIDGGDAGSDKAGKPSSGCGCSLSAPHQASPLLILLVLPALARRRRNEKRPDTTTSRNTGEPAGLPGRRPPHPAGRWARRVPRPRTRCSRRLRGMRNRSAPRRRPCRTWRPSEGLPEWPAPR